MNPLHEYVRSETRRQFFGRGVNAVGWAALASLMGHGRVAAPALGAEGGLPGLAHFAPKAKQVIYLHMVGGPSQLDLYDYKPKMGELYDKDLPDSVRMGQRLTTMTSGQKRFPIAPSKYKFAQHGKSGMWVSELLPLHGEDGRRHVLHPEHEHRGDQPRAGHHPDADRQHGHRPPLPRARGPPTAWAR